MNKRPELRDRSFRGVLSEQIRRSVRAANPGSRLHFKPGVTLAVLRFIAAVLSLVLAGGAVSLDRETAAIDNPPKAEQQPGPDLAPRVDIAIPSLDSQLTLAQQLLVMALSHQPVPEPPGTLVPQYFEGESQNTFVIHDQATPVVIQSPQPPEPPPSNTAEIAKIIADASRAIQESVEKQVKDVTDNAAEQTRAMKGLSSEEISQALAQFSALVAKSPDCCSSHYTVVNNETSSPVTTPAPPPANSLEPPCQGEFDIDVPPNGWSKCTQIVSCDKHSHFVRFSHSERAKPESTTKSTAKSELVYQYCGPTETPPPSPASGDLSEDSLKGFKVSYRSNDRSIPLMTHSYIHYFVQVFQIGTSSENGTRRGSSPEVIRTEAHK